MQAIQESNEHVSKAMSLLEQVKEPDLETGAYIEAQLANAKAIQALAWAILAHLPEEEKLPI